MRRYLCPALIAAILTGCSSLPLGANACTKSNVEARLEEMDQFDAEFEDGMQLAASTPRMSLASQIENLQAIRRRAETVEVPECMDDLKSTWIYLMEVRIDILIDFLAQDPVNTEQAVRALEMYDIAMTALLDRVGIEPEE